MSSSTTDKKIITLRSSDGVIFELDENAAVVSDLLKQMIDDGSTDEKAIPMHNVTGKILSKVVEYCTRHAEPVGEDAAANRDDELEAFDAEFVKVDQETLFEMILAANYMNVKGLFDLTCKTAADMIKGKTPEEVRELFNIVNDYTPQEEQEVRAQNAWAFE